MTDDLSAPFSHPVEAEFVAHSNDRSNDFSRSGARATEVATTNTNPPPFSHPVEAEFAAILDFYGVPWQYEPVTFVLARDAAGAVTEAFSPDFYLPDQDLYVELTTMLPGQIRHKNRKLRRLRELYPDVNVKLFKRGDIRSLLLKFGVEEYPDMLHNQL